MNLIRSISGGLRFTAWLVLGWIYVTPVSAETLESIKQSVRKRFPSVQQITTAELAAWLSDSGRVPPLLVDVRETNEFAVSHLRGALNQRAIIRRPGGLDRRNQGQVKCAAQMADGKFVCLPDIHQQRRHAARIGEPRRQFCSRNLLVDVRETNEFAVSHLRGALNLSLISSIQAARPSNNRPLVVYCSVGYRSSALAEKLQRAGLTNVVNLEGSIFAWANEGRPLYCGTNEVREVHGFSSKWRQLLQADVPVKL